MKLDRMDEGKEFFNQVNSKGAKSEGFNHIEKRLFGSEKVKKVDLSSKKSQKLLKDQMQSLIKLYTQGHYQEASTQASKLIKSLPNSFNL